MQNSDIDMIERELGIKLPDSYKAAVVPFRLKALAGNTDYELWDDAGRLVELNKKMRAGSRYCTAWPAHLFAVGDPYGDEMIGLDTRSADGPVWWLDHGMFDSKASYQSHAKFADWVEEFYRDLRSDLEGDGEDPDGDPKGRKEADARNALLDLLSLVVMGIVGFAILAGFFWIKKWLKHH
jgi:hypothetical protein